MDLSDALKTYLQNLPALGPIIGTGDDARVYLDLAREGVTKPFLVIEERAGASPENFGHTIGVVQGSYAVFSVGRSRGEANNLDEVVRLDLQLYGPARMGGVDGVWVCGVNAIGGRDTGVDLSRDSSQKHDYWTVREYIFHHILPNPNTAPIPP